jgi:hypothetical protein
MRVGSVSVLVSLVALSACGGTTFEKVDPAADLAHAQASVLTPTDVPGYTSAPHEPSDDTPAAAKQQFAACTHAPRSIFDDTPGAQKADSPDFSRGDASITNHVEIDPKQSDVDADWKVLSQPGIDVCFEQFFESAVQAGSAANPGVSIGAASVTSFDPAVGSRSAGFTVKFSASGSGGTKSFVADLILVARGRAEVDLDFFDVGSSLDRRLEVSLARKVYDRIGDSAK